MNIPSWRQVFDINWAIRRRRDAPTLAAAPEATELSAWPQYLAFCAGVFIEPFLAGYQKTGHWNFDGGWGRLLFALVMGIIAFAQIYQRALTDQPKSLLALLSSIFVSGIGWQTIIGAGAAAFVAK